MPVDNWLEEKMGAPRGSQPILQLVKLVGLTQNESVNVVDGNIVAVAMSK